MKERFNNFSYVPGRTVEELEQERLLHHLESSHTERFKKLIALIKVSKDLRTSINPKPNGNTK